MDKPIKSALISVFYKDGLEEILPVFQKHNVTIYSTGGTQTHIENLGFSVIPVEALTGYPGILGGRVKTLHPVVFGGILGKRSDAQHLEEMKTYKIPEIDLVIVDLYPFEETLANTNEEAAIIEKIDIGGPSMIRAAAKNFADLVVISSKDDYTKLVEILKNQSGKTTLKQRKTFAAKAFEVVKHYDIAIADYFSGKIAETPLRYGENPHQSASFTGHLDRYFEKLHGKELSYNNLVDIDAAMQFMSEFQDQEGGVTFGIFKHTNVCGAAQRDTVEAAWAAALAGDPESAFGGVLITNAHVNQAAAEAISEIFFEVLIAPGFSAEASRMLTTRKNRILLKLNAYPEPGMSSKSLLGGTLKQDTDAGNTDTWQEVGGRETTDAEKEELHFANLICKHLKSNAIALTKDRQLVGKGCGQTSRIDALRQAIEKSKQFGFDLDGAVLASDAFFPFDDCVKIAHAEGIEVFIQPGGSIRDKDSIDYCKHNGLAMVMSGKRHFRH